MSRDFSPRDCWIANKQCNDLYLQNIRLIRDGTEKMMYTEEELEDRRRFKHIAVLGCDIYNEIKKMLNIEQMRQLDALLKKLIETDLNGQDLSEFPKEIIDWYYNRHNHYYHEPNDEEFLNYLKNVWLKEWEKEQVKEKENEL